MRSVKLMLLNWASDNKKGKEKRAGEKEKRELDGYKNFIRIYWLGEFLSG